MFERLEDRRLLAAAPTLDAPLGDVVTDPGTALTYNLSTYFSPASSGTNLTYSAQLDLGSSGTEPRLEPIAVDLERPIQVVPADDDSGRVFVVEQTGKIQILNDGASDAQGPVLSSIYASVTATDAVVTFSTHEPAVGRIEYGLTASYGKTTAFESTFGTFHRVRLPDLASDKTYHYRITAVDSFGMQTIAAARTLRTQALAPSGELLYNGIVLPEAWPPRNTATQEYRVPPYLVSRPAVVPIDTGRQLFVDDFLIEDTTLVRTAHRPVFFEGNPVLEPDASPDLKGLAMPFGDGVWYDPADQLFKMWYLGSYGNMVSYAYSTDGVNWTKPVLVGAPILNTNTVVQIGGSRDSTTVWMDLQEPDPAKKFKMFAFNEPNFIEIRYSPDGIHWTLDSHTLYSASDRTTVFHNPFRDVWVESMRTDWTLPATPERPLHRVRARMYSESRDLQTWVTAAPTPDEYWVGPDVLDPAYYPGGAYPELYNLDAVPYESLMVGLFSWFQPGLADGPLPGPNLVDLGVGFSRDGFHWDRPSRGTAEESFLPVSNRPDTWNGYNTQSAGGGFLVVGDELWFYFSARSKQKPENGISSTGLAKLRRDGFYSMDAGPEESTLTTRPLTFTGTHAFVNVDNPQGRLQVEILDAAGNVIGPFSKENSIPVTADQTLLELRWRGVNDLSSIAGQAVRFRFHLTDGSLYSFWLSGDEHGAGGGYVAAGGPGFTGPRDTVGKLGYPLAADTSTIDQHVVLPLPSADFAGRPSQPLLDLTSKISQGVEQGIRSLALHPDFAQSNAAGFGKLYVSYTAPGNSGFDHDLVVSEFKVSATNPQQVDTNSERILLRIGQSKETNVGGELAFGPDDRLLYIGVGDGGGLGDPANHAQNLDSLLGKILRIDVGPAQGYGIPASNPYVGQSGRRGEIFAFGFRNPGAFAFDNGSGGASTADRLFVSDRGESQREEINLLAAGGNYGWPYREGTQVVKSGAPAGLIDPIAEYAHTAYGTAAAGGLVYRGPKYPEWQGKLLFGDHSGRLLALEQSANDWSFDDDALFSGLPLETKLHDVVASAYGDVYVVAGDSVYKVRKMEVAALPNWLNIDAASGKLTGTPTVSDVGEYDLRVTAREGSAAATYDVFQLRVAANRDLGIVEEDVKSIFSASRLLATDGDPTNDAFTVTSVSNAVRGTVSRISDTITFTPAANYSGQASFDYTLSNGSSGTWNIAVQPVDDAPTLALPPPQTTPLDTALLLGKSLGNTMRVSDIDSATSQLTLYAVNGTMSLAGSAGLTFTLGDGVDDDVFSFTGTLAAVNAALDGLRFTPEAGFARPTPIKIIAGTFPLIDEATLLVHVAATNAAPVLTLSGSTSFKENAGPLLLAPYAVLTDDGTTFIGGSLSASIALNASSDDRLAVRHQGTGAGKIGVSGANISYEGTIIGSFVGGVGSLPLVVTFNAFATPIVAQAVLRNITFQTLGDHPSTLRRTIRFSATDGAGNVSNVTFKTVAVTALNDAPAIASLDDATYRENDAPTSLASLVQIADPDSTSFRYARLTVTLLAGGDAKDRLTVQTQGIGAMRVTVTSTDVTYGGVLVGKLSGGKGTVPLEIVFNAAASVETLQAVARAIGFQTLADAPSVTPRIVRFRITDGAGGVSIPVTTTVSVIAVNDPPTLVLSGSLGYQRGSPAIAIVPGGDITDPDGGDFNGTKLTAHISSGATSSDVLEMGTEFTMLGGDVLLGEVVIGSLSSDGAGPTKWEITFNGAASSTIVKQWLRSIRFKTGGPTLPGPRIVSFTLLDGATSAISSVTKTINVK